MGDTGGGGFSFGGFFDALLGSLVAAIEAIINFLNALVRAIVGALNFLFAGEQAIFGFSFAGEKSIWGLFKHIADAIFRGGIIKALSHLLSLYQKLRAFLLKLKTWLDRFHALQQKYLTQSLRRVINIIQRVRKILVIFRLFHFKFAAKLDAWLAGIEGKIVRGLFLMARKTNVIISWLNWLLDPVGMIRRNVLVRSIAGALDDLTIALTGKSWAALFGLTVKITGAARKTDSVAASMKAGEQQIAGKTGDAGAIIALAPAIRANLFAEMGLPDVTNG